MNSIRVALPVFWAWSAFSLFCFAAEEGKEKEDSSKSAKDPPSVLTYHNDQEHIGWNRHETKLNPGNVNVHQFGLIRNLTVDAPVFAQALYVSGVPVGGSSHNLLIVATENDSVYAFDANSFLRLMPFSPAVVIREYG